MTGFFKSRGLNWFERFLLVASPVFIVGAVLWRFSGETVDHAGYGVIKVEMSDSVLSHLEQQWAPYTYGRIENERVFCISRYSVEQKPDGTSQVTVLSVYEPKAEATPMSVSYSCGMQPALHTHPPHQCTSDAVEAGNPADCWRTPESRDDNCLPSDTDIASTLTEWHRFHGIQCGPRKFFWFAPYWPS